MEKHKLINQQTKWFYGIQKNGYNVTTCPQCGVVVIMKNNASREAMKCYECGVVADVSDYPDLWY